MGGSPTINVPQANGSTSLATIMDLVRSLVNDTQAGVTNTPGEGQILTNNPAISPFTQPFKVSEIETDEYKLEKAAQEAIKELANKFHRVGECGRIE